MNRLYKKIPVLCLTVLMLAVLAVMAFLTKGMPVAENAMQYLSGEWSTQTATDPENEPYYAGTDKTVYALTMSHPLTAAMKGKVISFRTSDSYVDAYLTDSDGALTADAVPFYHFGERLKYSDSPGTYTHFISIPETSAAYLTIRVETVYANKFLTSYDTAIGTQNELVYNYLKSELLPCVSNIAMLIFGVLLLLIYYVGRAKQITLSEALSLGCLSIAFAINLNCPLFFNQYLYQNAVVQYYINYFSLFLLPLLAILYFEDIIPQLRMHWLFYGFLILEAVLSVLHFTQIATYTNTIKIFTAALGVLTVASIVMFARYYRQMEKINRIGIMLLLAFVFGNVVFFLFVSTIGDQTFIIRTGFLLYLALSILDGIRKLMEEMNRERETKLLHEIAYTDNLTHLGNRYALERDAAQCRLEQLSIISMDLNLLKFTNDSFGHAGGDVLLQSAAKCMLSVFDKVYRVGGDEFIALLEKKQAAELRAMNEALSEKAQEMNRSRSDYGEFADEPRFSLSIAAGYASYTDGDTNYEQIMSRADEAMYQAKKRMHQVRR